MQTVPLSWDELTTNHTVQTPRGARDRGPHPVENGGRGGRGAVARVWHEAVQGLVDTFFSIGVQCPSWVFLCPIAVLPHFWPNFIKPGCSLNCCQSFSCSYMSVQNCGARESNPESRWWSFTNISGQPSPATSPLPVNLARNFGAPVNLASIFVAPVSNLGTPWSALASNFGAPGPLSPATSPGLCDPL